MKAVLRLKFDDAEEGENVISDSDGQKIAGFIQAWKDKVELIVVHCEAGVSCSAGFCAALMLWLTGDDKAVFDMPFYKPNMRCCRIVLNQILKL